MGRASLITYPVGTRFDTPSVLCPFCSLSTSGWWGGHPVNTYPVGTCLGTPRAPCTLSFVWHDSRCHQGPRKPTVGVRRSDKSPRDAMLGGGLYASARLGFQPQVGSVAEVSQLRRGVGLETRPSPIHPTPGMDVASLVCALASLSVWWRHGEWAPFPNYPLARARADRRQPPPPHLLFFSLLFCQATLSSHLLASSVCHNHIHGQCTSDSELQPSSYHLRHRHQQWCLGGRHQRGAHGPHNMPTL